MGKEEGKSSLVSTRLMPELSDSKKEELSRMSDGLFMGYMSANMERLPNCMEKWIDYEKEKPVESWYYLCKIWVVSVNQYGNSTRFEVCYYDGVDFSGYPQIEFREKELMHYEKVLWWTKIVDPPLNSDHTKYPKYVEGGGVDE